MAAAESASHGWEPRCAGCRAAHHNQRILKCSGCFSLLARGGLSLLEVLSAVELLERSLKIYLVSFSAHIVRSMSVETPPPQPAPPPLKEPHGRHQHLLRQSGTGGFCNGFSLVIEATLTDECDLDLHVMLDSGLRIVLSRGQK